MGQDASPRASPTCVMLKRMQSRRRTLGSFKQIGCRFVLRQRQDNSFQLSTNLLYRHISRAPALHSKVVNTLFHRHRLAFLSNVCLAILRIQHTFRHDFFGHSRETLHERIGAVLAQPFQRCRNRVMVKAMETDHILKLSQDNVPHWTVYLPNGFDRTLSNRG